MLDINLIRENPEVVRRDLARRGAVDKIEMLEELIKLDKEWRRLQTKLSNLRHERNVITFEVARLKREEKDSHKKVQLAEKLTEEIRTLEKEADAYKGKINYILLRLPNILHDSVPLGAGEEDNVVIKKWGEIAKFDFTPLDHIELGLRLGVLDIERAAKISGARFFYLKREAVTLDMALINFALEEMRQRGFIPIEPPFLMRRKPYEGVTAMGDFEEMLYKVEDEDLYLIATSEHPIAAMFMNEVLLEKDLPLRYVGVSPCFRKEAGAHGKDTKGIFRTHQFNKVEQFVFCKPEESWVEHERLLENAESIIQKLGLPYRITNVCTGDIGTVAAKKYDIEVWMPAQKQYREVISCSNCTDYQARRLNIKYREMEGRPPKGFVHTLNSTAIATGRIIVAILENFQERDGSVRIPEALQSYMRGVTRISKD